MKNVSLLAITLTAIIISTPTLYGMEHYSGSSDDEKLSEAFANLITASAKLVLGSTTRLSTAEIQAIFNAKDTKMPCMNP